MPYAHKRPSFRVIFYRRKEIMLFYWAQQHSFGIAKALADELATTLGLEWTVEVLDTHNRVDHQAYAIAYETRGASYG